MTLSTTASTRLGCAASVIFSFRASLCASKLKAGVSVDIAVTAMSTETPAFSFDAHKLALKLKITLAAHPNLVDAVVESVMDQIRKAHCATDKADAVELALTEALAKDRK